MAEISSLNATQNQINSQSLYFAATQAAGQQLVGQAKKTEKKENRRFGRFVF